MSNSNVKEERNKAREDFLAQLKYDIDDKSISERFTNNSNNSNNNNNDEGHGEFNEFEREIGADGRDTGRDR